MARDLVEILLRARGGRQVSSETRQASGGVDKMRRSLDHAGKAAGRFGSSIRTASKWALRGGAVLAGGLIYELKRSTDAWEEHTKVVGDTRQVVKTTGGVANVTARHVDKLANSIEAKTAVDDDATAAGQNMLLTFLRVRNEQGKGNKVFDRATGLAVDMAARFGGDVPGAFKTLGKALDDPSKGLLALRRTGVTFTKAEQKKIKTLEDTGRHLEAQKIILAALDKQVGGSARAQARPLDKMKRSFEDVEKVVGRGVSPAITAASVELKAFADRAEPMFNALGRDMEKLADRKDLSLGEKLVEAGHLTGRHLEPLANEIKQSLKDAELDEKLADAIEWAVPKMAEAFATAGPAAVKALVHGFEEAGPAGKLLIAWFAGKKLGLGKIALGGLLGGGKGGLLQRGGTPANPLFVVDIASGGGKSWIDDVWKKAKGPAGGAAGAGALAKYGSKALRFGKFAGPVGVGVGVLADPDSADVSPARNRGLLSEVYGNRRGTGPLRDYPDSHPHHRRTGRGPISRRDREVVAELVAPIRLDVDGERFADAQAKIRVRYKHRR